MLGRVARKTVSTTLSAITAPARIAAEVIPGRSVAPEVIPGRSVAPEVDTQPLASPEGANAAPEGDTPVGGSDGHRNGDEPLLDLTELFDFLDGGAGFVEDVVEEGVDLLEDALGLHRRVWEDEDHDHAQIEVHGIEDPAAVGMRRRLAQALSRFDGVRWAEVNAITGRVAVAFDGGEPTLAGLIELIEGVEQAFGAKRQQPRPGWDTEERADHPADDEPIHRVIAIMAGDTLSLGWTALGRAFRLRALPPEFAGLVSVVENNPWLRLQSERVLGRRVAALVIPLTSAALSGVTQGPFGTLLDLGVQSTFLAEMRARRRVWDQREPQFYAVHSDEPIDPPDLVPRPEPLLVGPIERWSVRSSQLGAAAAGTSFAASRDLRTSADLLIASAPKAARIGREAFAALLGRTLAYRGIVPLDGSALRRLDRIDTVVLDAEVLVGDGPQVRSVVTPSGSDADQQAAGAVRRLYEPSAPTKSRRRSPWALMPFEDLDDEVVSRARGAKSRAREIRSRSATPLGLTRDGELVAIAEVATEFDPGMAAVIDAVRAAGHDLLVADEDGRLAEAVEADGRLQGGDQLGDEVRDLQALGAGVMVIGRQGHRGLAAADVGLGVLSPTGRPSWGADLILGRDLADAATIVTASRVAREVSERSVRLAMGGSALGALVSLTGPRLGAGSRALAMVNGAAGAALISGAWEAIQLSHEPRPRVPDRTNWHDLTAARVLEETGSNGRTGLASGDAAQRRTVSSLTGDQVGILEPFLAELANPLNPVLGAGAGLSAAAGSMNDAALVMGLIAINTAVGGVQRLRADRTVRHLLSDDVEDATVLRDGVEVRLPEPELVRGDILVLHAGDAVPADARVIESDACEVDESSLTGESLPVTKSPEPTPGAEMADRTCMLYEDSTIVAGSVRAVVVATGEHTEVARSLALTGPPPPTGVELRLDELTRRLLPAAMGVAGLTAGVGLLRRWPVSEVTGTAVSLAIASVPEGLPFVATAGQLAGARRLARTGAIVRNPRTVEALGRVDVLCVDKTGTLTEGRVAVAGVSDGRTEMPLTELVPSFRRTLAAALRASDQPGARGRAVANLDDSDRALHAAAAQIGLDADQELGSWSLVDELPFEASRGLHAVLGQVGGEHRILVKGAPEVVLDACEHWSPAGEQIELDAATRREVAAGVDALARQGRRLLAVADRAASSDPEVEHSRVERLCLRGFIVLADPVRQTAAAAVRGIAEAGVRTIMVTGDHPETAASIARQLGLNDDPQVLTGAELSDLDDDQLAERLETAVVVARVTPADKLRIVSVLQGAGRVVAMTGDGANDAAAIRLAEVGVALGERSSSAAREAADIVVTDDRVETLIDAIAEGRALWGSIREAIAVLVGGNLGEIGFTTLTSLVSEGAPLQPRQFLLVNLFTDLAPAVAIAVRPPADVTPETLLHEGPDVSLGEALRRDIAIRGTATALGASAAWYAARMTGTRKRAGTVALAALVGAQLGQTVMAGGWRQPTTLLTVAGSATALVAAIQTPGVSRFFGSRPLGPVGWSQAAAASVAATIGSEVASRVIERMDAAQLNGEADEFEPPPVSRRRRAPVNRPGEGPPRTLVAGAAGCVGNALVPRLLDEGHEVVCLVRDASKLDPAVASRVTVVEGSAADAQTVLRAAQGTMAAYYLVQTLGDGVADLAERERRTAAAFADGVDLAGVGRVIYVGRLVNEDVLSTTSEHVFARQQVGEELRAGPVPVTEIRVGLVLANTSAPFRLLHAASRSVATPPARLRDARVQPVAIGDLVDVLLAASGEQGHHGILEVGDATFTNGELMELARDQVGRGPQLRRSPVGWLPVEALAPILGPLAGASLPAATALLQAATDDAVGDDHLAGQRYASLLRTSAEVAVTTALPST